MMSQRQMAFAKLLYSSPEYNPVVIPVGGGERVAVAMARKSRYTGRMEYGQVLAAYQHRRRAETLVRDLSEAKARMLSLAYP